MIRLKFLGFFSNLNPHISEGSLVGFIGQDIIDNHFIVFYNTKR